MPQSTYDRPIKEVYGEVIALTTTASHQALRKGFHAIKGFHSAEWRLGVAPKLLNCLFYNGTTGAYSDHTANVTDGSSSTHAALDGMTTSDYLYLGFSGPTRGFYIDMGSNVNAATTSTLDMEYCSTAVAQGATIAFTDVAGDSDGTSSGNVTLAVDGLYSFTLPTAWVPSTLGTSAAPYQGKCYWIRFTPNKTLSTPLDINEIIPAARTTNYDYCEANVTNIYHLNLSEIGALEYKITSDTGNMHLTWIKY